ncbi:MAG: hypothetical protein V7607_4087 [Solirubrobacteraceae bacterium]
MHRRFTVVLAALALALCAPGSAAAADCPGADAVPAADNLPAIGQATLCLVNEQRTEHGLGALRTNARLSSASIGYSQRMVTQAFFDHQAPDGTTLVQRLTSVGYLNGGDDWVVGENIGWGQGPLSTPRAMVTAWMNSSGHRRNILATDYGEIGLGLAIGTPEDATWGATYTTDFGHKPPKKAKRRQAVARTACVRAAQARKQARFTVAILSYPHSGCSGRRAQQSSRSS